MENKICPFCGSELVQERDYHYKIFYICPNQTCKRLLSEDLKKWGTVYFSHGFPIIKKDVLNK